MSRDYDILYSLDKDNEAICVAEQANAKKKYGFGMDSFGRCRAFNDLAIGKLETGLFDDISKNNSKSYPQEIFEMCGFAFSGEEYLLDIQSKRTWKIDHSKIITDYELFKNRILQKQAIETINSSTNDSVSFELILAKTEMILAPLTLREKKLYTLPIYFDLAAKKITHGRN